MAEYDPQILQKFADRLYSQAAGVIAPLAIAGFLIGAVAGGAVGSAIAKQLIGTLMLVGGIIAGLIGWQIGRERAFHLKLEAQRTLCHLQIEKNTRIKESTTPPLVKEKTPPPLLGD